MSNNKKEPLFLNCFIHSKIYNVFKIVIIAHTYSYENIKM